MVIGPSDPIVVILIVIIQPRGAKIILKYVKITKSGFFTHLDHWVITVFSISKGRKK